MQTIHDACAANSDLKVTILLDFLRGTRGLKAGKSSVNTLSQLIGTYAESVNLSLYHTPLLSGALKLFAPERCVLNEKNLFGYLLFLERLKYWELPI